jgi:hypothetical protein
MTTSTNTAATTATGGVKAVRPDGAATSPLRAIRAKCLDDCCCGSIKAVRFCTCDGVNSTRCSLWPFRFGKRPSTIRKGPLARLLDAGQMPDAGVALEDCR